MHKKNHLYQLIQGMNQGEKRYFKMFASTFEGKNKTYIKLYNAIAQQKEYDEQALKKKFKNESFVKHFAVVKNNLFNLILKALRFYHSNDNPHEKVAQYKDNYMVLLRKGMHELATVQLNKAIKLAEEYDLFTEKVVLAHWQNNEKMLATFHQSLDVEVEKQLRQPIKYIEELKEHHLYNLLNRKVELFHIKNTIRTQQAQQTLQNFSEDPLLSEEQIPTPLLTMGTKLTTQISCYVSMKQYEKAQKLSEQQINLVLNNLDFYKIEPLVIACDYMNYIYTSIRSKDWAFCQKIIQDCLKVINDLEKNKLFTRSHDDNILFDLHHSFELEHYLFHSDFNSAKSVLSSTEIAFQNIKESINPLYFLHYHYNLAYAHFGIDNYEEAQKYLVELLNSPILKTRKDYLAATHLLNLMTHYELGNFEFLSYQIKNVKQLLQRQEYLFGFEATTLELLGKLYKAISTTNKLTILKKYQPIFESLSKQSWEKDAFERLNMCWWIEQKVQMHAAKTKETLV